MVTRKSQELSEFDLHLRAILGLPIRSINSVGGASAVILSDIESSNPGFTGLEQALEMPKVDVRIFGKPTARKNRRMGVVLADNLNIARSSAEQIKVVDNDRRS